MTIHRLTRWQPKAAVLAAAATAALGLATIPALSASASPAAASGCTPGTAGCSSFNFTVGHWGQPVITKGEIYFKAPTTGSNTPANSSC